MQGYLALVLHAHLPFVRHPEHPKFLEEHWLFEAITECYIPLLQKFEGWREDGMKPRLTLTLTPTLCAMLRDELLQQRYWDYLKGLIELAEKETHRTYWDKKLHPLAEMYLDNLTSICAVYESYGRDLVRAFREFQDAGLIEIITCAATHALLPLLEHSPESMRAQILIGRDHYAECFGKDPEGIWLPECAYVPAVDPVLREAGIRWFITDTHGILHARPRPRFGVFAPIYTSQGIAAFGRDHDSAKQVWSRDEGYPGDRRYRDFYKDAAFDLDYDYIRPYMPAPPQRSFTGIKYHRIGEQGGQKEIYDRKEAIAAAGEHAGHFLSARLDHLAKLDSLLDRPPIMLCPYDAELFGHWWHEGPDFLDFLVRKITFDQHAVQLITPSDYLQRHPENQIAAPSPSSWGEEGFWKVWLNEKNEWIYRHLNIAQERMASLVDRIPHATPLQARALKQAGRELLLAQSSDWPFILRTGTSPEYAARRVKDHLLRFIALHEQLTSTSIDEAWLGSIERTDNLFPDLDYEYWRPRPQ
jgi:1,4-alpha-glucan branching enzyme